MKEEGLSPVIDLFAQDQSLPSKRIGNQVSDRHTFRNCSARKRKRKTMLPFVPATQARPRNFKSMRSTTVDNLAPYEVHGANMPQTAGILLLTIRVGNIPSSYKLNKVESARPNPDYVYFHLEKY